MTPDWHGAYAEIVEVETDVLVNAAARLLDLENRLLDLNGGDEITTSIAAAAAAAALIEAIVGFSDRDFFDDVADMREHYYRNPAVVETHARVCAAMDTGTVDADRIREIGDVRLLWMTPDELASEDAAGGDDA